MRFRDFHPNVKIRIYVMFLVGLAQAMTYPFMAIYFAKYFGETFTGALFTVSIAGSIVSGALGGYYADRIGRKKLMVASECAFLIAYVTTAIANSPWFESPILTAITFFVISVAWGVYAPADEAMLLDVTTSETRTLMYQIFYWSHNLTMALGAGAGAFLFESHRFELFSFMSLAVLCSLLATLFLIEETYDPSKIGNRAFSTKIGKRKGFVQNYLLVIKDSIFMIYCFAGLLLMTLEFQLPNYIAIRLAKEVSEQTLWFLQIDGVKLLGFLQTENTVLVVLLAGIVAKMIKRYSDQWVLYLGSFLFTFGYSVITTSSTPLLLLGAMLIATIGEVMRVPVQQVFLGDIAPSHARSSYMAVNGMVFQGARVLSSLGVMLGTILSSWQMGMVAFCMGFAGIFLYRSIMPDLRERRNISASISA